MYKLTAAHVRRLAFDRPRMPSLDVILAAAAADKKRTAFFRAAVNADLMRRRQRAEAMRVA